MTNTITLWGAGTLRAHRVHWALHELNLDYRCEPIQSRSGETLTATYTALNPKQKIPFLQDGEFGLSESAAILNYLFASYGDAAEVYLPQTEQQRARSDEWCYFIMTELDAHSLYIIRRHGDLSAIYGETPVAVASAEQYFLKQMAAVAPRIEAADPYLFGDRLGVADILLTTCLDWALMCDFFIDAGCHTYRERTTARPAYAASLAANAVAGN